MGTNYYVVKNEPTVYNPIHIGKSSAGWKFLFHSVDACDNYISNEPLNTFSRWNEFLKEQISNGNVVIKNEYDENVSLEEFLKWVEIQQSENNPDDFTCSENIDGYRFANGKFS